MSFLASTRGSYVGYDIMRLALTLISLPMQFLPVARAPNFQHLVSLPLGTGAFPHVSREQAARLCFATR
eukprot:10152595-Lingulodinium_polyedra.AAC.1